MSAVAGAQKRGRYGELEALRGVSAVSIVVLHAYQNSRGPGLGYAYGGIAPVQHLLFNLDYGLGVFFALSGFVIFLPFARAIIDDRPHMGVREFAARRAFRILPLYYVAIFVVWNSRYSGGPGQVSDLVRHLTFTQIYNNSKIFYTIGPSWSLAVEMHYYVLTAVLIWCLTKLGRRVRSRRRRIALVAAPAALLAVASIAYKGWAFYIQHYGLDNFAGPRHYTVYYSAIARADSYAFGMLLAVLVVVAGAWRPKSPWLARTLLAAALGLYVVMAAFRSDQPTDSHFVDLYYYTGVGLAATLVMAAIVFSNPDRRWMRILRCAPLQFLGLVSYSLYLWHEPLMLWLQSHHILAFKGVPAVWPLSAAALLAVGIGIAWISYRVIEVPGQRLLGMLRIARPRRPAVLQSAGTAMAASGRAVSTLPTLHGEDGVTVELGEFGAGRPVVAFVQPHYDADGAEHPECLVEARAFRDSMFIFDALGVGVVGISATPPAVQRELRDREKLPFPMLSDPDCSFAGALGLPVWRSDDGRLSAERAVLVIDGDGTIREVLGREIPTAARAGVAAARSERWLIPVAAE